MKATLTILCVILGSTLASAEIKSVVNSIGNIAWTRDGAKKLIRYKDKNTGGIGYLISHRDLKDSRPTYLISVTEGLIGKITPWSDAAACSFRLHDLDGDGFDEVFEIIDITTHETLEGCMLIRGDLEPIPDRMFIKSEEGSVKLDLMGLALHIQKSNE